MALLDDIRKENEGSPELHLQEVLTELFEQIGQAMDKQGISRAELAARTGKKPGQISAILNRKSNITIRVILEIALALNLRMNCVLVEESDFVPYSSAFSEAESSPEHPSESCSDILLGHAKLLPLEQSPWLENPQPEKCKTERKSESGRPSLALAS